MGLDGGTIPTRGELVQVKKKPEQKDKAADTLHKWSNCTITQSPLEVPIVACHLGMLFSKKSVVEMLLKKPSVVARCKTFQHIESLRDVKELQLTNNRCRDRSSAPYICPITGLEMNGKHKFVCLWECGCVLSERAMKEVPSTQCHKCGMAYTTTDIVMVNPTDDEFAILKLRMEERKASRKTTVKHNSRDTESTDAAPTASNIEMDHSSGSSVYVESKKRTHDDDNHHGHDKISGHKSKRHKDQKHKKDKKHKHKAKHRHSKKDLCENQTPKIHPGWSSILARRS